MNKSYRLILALFFSALCGCAGGTKGTGSKEFEGRLLDFNDAALSAVDVTLLETGDTAVTDSEGRFSLRARLQGQASFLFESDEFSLSAKVGDIPRGVATVTLAFKVNNDRSEVELVDRQIRESNSGPGNDGDDGHSGEQHDDESEDDGEGKGGGGSNPSDPDDDEEEPEDTDNSGSGKDDDEGDEAEYPDEEEPEDDDPG